MTILVMVSSALLTPTLCGETILWSTIFKMWRSLRSLAPGRHVSGLEGNCTMPFFDLRIKPLRIVFFSVILRLIDVFEKPTDMRETHILPLFARNPSNREGERNQRRVTWRCRPGGSPEFLVPPGPSGRALRRALHGSSRPV